MALGVEGSEFDKTKENKLIQELESVQMQFQEALQGIFGMKLEANATTSLGGELSKNLLVIFLRKGLSILKQQQRILRESKYYDKATNLDISDEDVLTLTDFERALEFLDETTSRRSDLSLKKIMRLVVSDARAKIDDISPMPYKKPSPIFPRGLLTTPIFGVFDRSIWGQQQYHLQNATKERIDQVEGYVNEQVRAWAGQTAPNLLELERS